MKKHARSPIVSAAGAAVAAALLGTAFSVAQADEQKSSLDGWGGLRFGMTVDEARGVAGHTWSEPENAEVNVQGKTVLWTFIDAKEQVSFGGHAFDLQVDFDDKGSLNQIQLKGRDAADTFARCDAAFAKLVAEGERQFGAYRPVQTAHAEKHDAAQEKDGKVSDWVTKIENRTLPAGKSVYEYLLVKWRKKPESAWHISHIENAIRPFSASYTEVTASFSAKEPCELVVGFAAGPYPFERLRKW